MVLENLSPTVYSKQAERQITDDDWDDDVVDEFDSREIFGNYQNSTLVLILMSNALLLTIVAYL